jgi:hypothetical protein
MTASKTAVTGDPPDEKRGGSHNDYMHGEGVADCLVVDRGMDGDVATSERRNVPSSAPKVRWGFDRNVAVERGAGKDRDEDGRVVVHPRRDEKSA